jgi:hypothetical protein
VGDQDPRHTEAVELTIEELDVLVAAVDCCMRLGGELAPHAPDLLKRARGKLLFAHRKAWLRRQGLEESLTDFELAKLRASLMGGQSWSPDQTG